MMTVNIFQVNVCRQVQDPQIVIGAVNVLKLSVCAQV